MCSRREHEDAEDATKRREVFNKKPPLEELFTIFEISKIIQHPYLRMWYRTIFCLQYVTVNFLLVKVMCMGLKVLKLTKLFSSLFTKLIQVSISKFCIQLWEIFTCACILRNAQEQWRISQPTAIMATMITLSFTKSSWASWSR